MTKKITVDYNQESVNINVINEQNAAQQKLLKEKQNSVLSLKSHGSQASLGLYWNMDAKIFYFRVSGAGINFRKLKAWVRWTYLQTVDSPLDQEFPGVLANLATEFIQ